MHLSFLYPQVGQIKGEQLWYGGGSEKEDPEKYLGTKPEISHLKPRAGLKLGDLPACTQQNRGYEVSLLTYGPLP